MSSIRYLLKGLQRLSLVSSAAASVSLGSRKHGFHTSCVLARILDNRRRKPFKEPSSTTGRWAEYKCIDDVYDYTTDPIPLERTGGRGPNGRIWVHRIGGGDKRYYHMIDWKRMKPEDGQLLKEKVQKIIVDQNRSANIALVASGDKKRYIIATHSMKPGDIIEASCVVTKSTVLPKEGNTYPLGSLPLGTLVNCVERVPGDGGKIARAAGVTASIVRKFDDKCVIRMPSKREVCVSGNCLATVGRVSNIDHNKRIMGKAGANRWLGIRPRSGRWHRKTGRFGRKVKAVKKTKTYTEAGREKPADMYLFPSKTVVNYRKDVKILPYREHVAVNRPIGV